MEWKPSDSSLEIYMYMDTKFNFKQRGKINKRAQL